MESENSISKCIEQYSRDDGMNIIDSNEHVLKVSEHIIYDCGYIIVCKGTYDGIPVAIKITSVDSLFNDEMKVYTVLNDDDPESHGIPKVYYHGTVFKISSYNAIAMSLFENTIEHRYKNELTRILTPFSDFSVLHIFNQAVI